MQAIKYLYLHPQPRYNKAIQRWRTPEYSAATLCTYLICRDGSAKIVGCYLPYLILNEQKSAWLWLPTALSLAVFVYLLTLYPAASGRILQLMAVFMSALHWFGCILWVKLRLAHGTWWAQHWSCLAR